MNHNKNYFLLYTSNLGNITFDGTGQIFNNMSLRYILGHLYDRYNAFSIKLEGFINRAANTVVIGNDFLLLHIDGLPFMNSWDTCPNYRSSRVLEMLDFAGVGNNGYNFISNCNGVNFWKPSTENVNLKFFLSRISDESLMVTNDDVNYVFSITGLDAYKVIHPTRDIIIPRLQAMKTSNLTLCSYKGVSIDSRNRAFRIPNINLKQLIGSDYDRYKKFALITKSYALSEWNGSSYTQVFSGFSLGNMLISGLDWFRPSTPQYSFKGTLEQQNEINAVHPTPACVACQVVLTNGGNIPRSFKETYIENVFEKSQDVIDIIVSYNQIYGYMLVPVNANNTQLFPHFTLVFDIVPLND